MRFGEGARKFEKPANILLQWLYRSSGMLWLVSICVSDPPRGTSALLTYPITLCSISGWEIVTTLDYELSAIRRHRDYRWTIRVRDARLLLPSPEPWTDLLSSVDLLHYSDSDSGGCNNWPIQSQRHDLDTIVRCVCSKSASYVFTR